MHFTGSISFRGAVLAGVAGDMNGISGTRWGYYGAFVPKRSPSPDFDVDALYRLDIDHGPSMSVHVMNSAGPGSAVGEAVFRSRGSPHDCSQRDSRRPKRCDLPLIL